MKKKSKAKAGEVHITSDTEDRYLTATLTRRIGGEARGHHFSVMLTFAAGIGIKAAISREFSAGCNNWHSLKDALDHYSPTRYRHDGDREDCAARLRLLDAWADEQVLLYEPMLLTIAGAMTGKAKAKAKKRKKE